MASNTPNFKLKKPAQTDFYDVDDFNGNMDIIDAELKKCGNASDVLLPDGKSVAEAIEDLTKAVTENTSKLTTLWNSIFSDITTNPFQITFVDLSGISLISGIWNAALQRMEC